MLSMVITLTVITIVVGQGGLEIPLTGQTEQFCFARPYRTGLQEWMFGSTPVFAATACF